MIRGEFTPKLVESSLKPDAPVPRANILSPAIEQEMTLSNQPIDKPVLTMEQFVQNEFSSKRSSKDQEERIRRLEESLEREREVGKAIRNGAY